MQGTRWAGAERDVARVGVPPGPRGPAPTGWGWACCARSPPLPGLALLAPRGRMSSSPAGRVEARAGTEREGGRQRSGAGRLGLGRAGTGPGGARPEREGRPGGGGSRPQPGLGQGAGAR